MEKEVETLQRKVTQRESDYQDKEHEFLKIKDTVKNRDDDKKAAGAVM